MKERAIARSVPRTPRLEAVRAAAVVHVGDRERMRAFYEGCFALTPVKLAFGVTDIDALRPTIARLGGDTDGEWRFGDALHCDCVDPEGNVVQLIQSA
jgi:hypothetical protein